MAQQWPWTYPASRCDDNDIFGGWIQSMAERDSQSWSDPSLTASIHNAAFGNMLLFSDTAASFPGRSAHISIHCASPRVKAIGYSYASLSASWTEGWASELVRGKVATAWVAAVAGEAKVRLRIEVQARDRWPAR
ncbi:hypothetical protein B0H13DRAFT_1921708 [Mycena leptocephala]|nr:hypothetical protein B0H13DRAFT_1921708 [Mycena leptocephala]